MTNPWGIGFGVKTECKTGQGSPSLLASTSQFSSFSHLPVWPIINYKCKCLGSAQAEKTRGKHHQLHGVLQFQPSSLTVTWTGHCSAPGALGQEHDRCGAKIIVYCNAHCWSLIILSSCNTVGNSNCDIPTIPTILFPIIILFLALALACLGKITWSLCFIFLHQEANIILELHYVTVLQGHNMSKLEAEHLPPSRTVLSIVNPVFQCLLPQTVLMFFKHSSSHMGHTKPASMSMYLKSSTLLLVNQPNLSVHCCRG